MYGEGAADRSILNTNGVTITGLIGVALSNTIKNDRRVGVGDVASIGAIVVFNLSIEKRKGCTAHLISLVSDRTIISTRIATSSGII